MTDAAVSQSLAFYSAHRAALFPIPAGQKAPYGIVPSFALDCSSDPAQWAAWSVANPGCNWGVVAGPSRWIIADVDVSEVGRERAWELWSEWWQSRGLSVPPSPHVQSARGGWHYYFQVPDNVDATALRQVALIGPQSGFKKAVVDLRAGNGFTVAAGSYYDGTAKGEASGPYVLLSNSPPYPAPAALIEHCTRADTPVRVTKPGDRDRNDVAALIKWLAERTAFAAYEDWVGVGMALKIEFGDDGLDLWQIAHDATVDADTEATKWASFASEPTAGVQTLNSWLDRAHKLGWRGTVRKSAASMFGEAGQVAAIAAAAGATLPGAVGSVPMLAGQEVLCTLGQPIVDEFLASAGDAPLRPTNTDYPTLPEACSGHGLYAPLRAAIDRIVAMAETPKSFRSSRVVDVLAVLSLVHQDTADAVCRRIRALGCALPDNKIRLYANAIRDKVERAFVKQDDWQYGPKGEIENDNSDNVAVFLGILGIEIRWNGWLERAELRGGSDSDLRWPDWTYIDDTVVAKLRTRGNRTKTRFRPSKEFFWESLIALAQQSPHDPATAYLADLADRWDLVPRLSIWLTATCGVPCDPYHQAVGRNIIGGIVRRIRHPGCKHDTMPVFFGFQGSGKSTLAKLLAGREDWFTDTVMLGDASKELVLSLAGKSVVEIGEMGMRGAANPNHVKAMISRQVDAGRTAYARSVSERPRRNIFVGTTNDDEPLVDPTGNRRFLPVRVLQEIDLAWAAKYMGQLIGEAAVLEAMGEDFSLPRAVWGAAAEYQESARSESDVEIRLSDWFAPTAASGPLTWIASHDLAELTALAGWRSGGANSARGAIMKQLGFVQESVQVAGKRTKIWVRGECAVKADIPRMGTRYSVSTDATGRPRITIIAPASEAPAAPTGAPAMPALPPIG